MKKKPLFLIILVMLILIMSVPVFAAEKSAHEIAYEYYTEIWDASEELPDADKERVRKLTNQLWFEQLNTIEKSDYPGTIQDGAYVIKRVVKEGYEVKNSFFNTDRNALLFETAWSSRFNTHAQSLGMDSGDPITAAFGNGSFFSSDENEIADNTANVNILTWETKDKSVLHEGQIKTIINVFDTGFKDFTSIILAISIALAIAYEGVTLIQLAADRNVTGDALTRAFFQLLLGIWIMCNYKYFALLLVRLGTLITELVQKVGTEGGNKTSTYQTTVAIWESFKNVLESCSSPNAMTADLAMGQLSYSSAAGSSNTIINVIGHLGGTVVYNFVISLIVYAVAIEIGIRFIFTPLAIADLYSEKMRSSGFNWLKKLLAVSLQGAIIFLIIYGSTKLKNASGVNNIAVNLCSIGMLAGSKLIANEIVGVR